MDKFDQSILDLLAQNARQSIAAIGEQIGLSRTAVNERIRKLEENDTIRRYTIERGGKSQNQLISVYFELTFRPFDIETIKPLIRGIPEIKQAHSLSGLTDVLLYVEAPTMEEVNNIRTKLVALPNLDKIQTSMSLESLLP